MWRRWASIVRTLRLRPAISWFVYPSAIRRRSTLALAEIVLGLANHQSRRERRVHVDPIGEHGVDRIGELLVRRVLYDVSLGAELEGLAGVGRLVLHGEDHYPRPPPRSSAIASRPDSSRSVRSSTTTSG